MTFSYNAVWDDAVKLLRANGPLLAAVAGVFVFLPVLLVGHFLPPPEPSTTDLSQTTLLILNHFQDNLIWYALQSLVVMIGTAAMLRLVLVPGTSVGGALRFGFALLPVYSILVVLANLVVGVGAFFFLLPGLYLLGRLVPAGPAMVGEDRRNPLDALKRGFTLTAGRGWAVLGLLLLVAIPGLVLIVAIQNLVGIGLLLAAGPDLGRLLVTILWCALWASLMTVLNMVYAAVYRALVSAEAAA